MQGNLLKQAELFWDTGRLSGGSNCNRCGSSQQIYCVPRQIFKLHWGRRRMQKEQHWARTAVATLLLLVYAEVKERLRAKTPLTARPKAAHLGLFAAARCPKSKTSSEKRSRWPCKCSSVSDNSLLSRNTNSACRAASPCCETCARRPAGLNIAIG